MGAGAAAVAMRCAVSGRPRDGRGRLFWDMEKVYDALHLDQYGYASAWANNSYGGWGDRIFDWFGIKTEGATILRSDHCGNPKGSEKQFIVMAKALHEVYRTLHTRAFVVP